MKKVSILIPCYNSEKFIAETLESCKRQTYKNWEVIVVDDGSKDQSFEIAKRYESDCIKVYRQVNSGACRARNLAFEKSIGEYIVYLDADDIISPNFIAKHITVLESSKLDTVSFCAWGKFHDTTADVVFRNLPIYKNYSPGAELLIDMWQGGYMLQTTCYVIPRDLVIKSGGWDESVLKNQDGEFFSRVLCLAKEAKYVPEPKVYYRTGEYMSISRTKSIASATSLLYTLRSYCRTILQYEDSKRTRIVLAMMFTSFIYVYGNLYPVLYKQAKQDIKLLNTGYILKHEPHRVIQICKIIGFDNFMTLRKFILKR